MANTVEIVIKARDEASRSLKGISKSMDGIAASAGRAGRSLTLLSAPLIGIGILAVKTFAEFEQSMARVGAVSGATAEELVELTAIAEQMGRTTVFSARESAQALVFLSQAGLSVTAQMQALPKVLQLAAAGQLELGTAADIVTNVLAGFGLEVTDLARANDVLTTAFTSANTNLQQLGQAFKFAGPVAKAAGISFEETASALALLGNAGLQASAAGTGLRGSITKLLNPTKEAEKILARLGVTVTNSAGEMIPFVEIISQFETVGLTAADAMAIFGQRAGPAMLALVSQGSDAMRELTKSMLESGGVAEEIARKQLDTLMGQMVLLKSATEGTLIAIGRALVPALLALLAVLQPVIVKITEFAEAHPNLVAGLVAAGLAVGALGVALLTVSLLLPGVAVGVGLLAGGFSGLAVAASVANIALVSTIGSLTLLQTLVPVLAVFAAGFAIGTAINKFFIPQAKEVAQLTDYAKEVLARAEAEKQATITAEKMAEAQAKVTAEIQAGIEAQREAIQSAEARTKAEEEALQARVDSAAIRGILTRTNAIVKAFGQQAADIRNQLISEGLSPEALLETLLDELTIGGKVAALQEEQAAIAKQLALDLEEKNKLKLEELAITREIAREELLALSRTRSALEIQAEMVRKQQEGMVTRGPTATELFAMSLREQAEIDPGGALATLRQFQANIGIAGNISPDASGRTVEPGLVGVAPVVNVFLDGDAIGSATATNATNEEQMGE